MKKILVLGLLIVCLFTTQAPLVAMGRATQKGKEIVRALDVRKIGTAAQQFYKQAEKFPRTYKTIEADLRALMANITLAKQTPSIDVKIDALSHIIEILTRITQRLIQMLEPGTTFVGVFSKDLESQGKSLTQEVQASFKMIDEINKQTREILAAIRKAQAAMQKPVPAAPVAPPTPPRAKEFEEALKAPVPPIPPAPVAPEQEAPPAPMIPVAPPAPPVTKPVVKPIVKPAGKPVAPAPSPKPAPREDLLEQIRAGKALKPVTPTAKPAEKPKEGIFGSLEEQILKRRGAIAVEEEIDEGEWE